MTLPVWPTVLVRRESTMEERGLPLKSEETSSSVVKPRMPLSGPSAAALRAALTVAAVMGFSEVKVRSTT
jgi:hypothetical protein